MVSTIVAGVRGGGGLVFDLLLMSSSRHIFRFFYDRNNMNSTYVFLQVDT